MDPGKIVVVASHGRDWFDILSILVGGVGLFFLIRYTHHAKKQRQAAEKANTYNALALAQADIASGRAWTQAAAANALTKKAFEQSRIDSRLAIEEARKANAIARAAQVASQQSNLATDRLNREALEETRRSNAATERSKEIAEKALIYGRRSWLIPNVDALSPIKGETGWR